MKKIILTTLFLITLFGIAQPVLNASDYNPVNVTVNRFTASSPTLGVGNAGADQTWDFSSLTLAPQVTITTTSVATAPFSGSFPGANLFLKNTTTASTTYEYYNWNSSIIELVGGSTSTFVQYTFSNPSTIYTFPFSYGNSFTDTATLSGSTQSKTVTYDAYGTLITTYGTFNNIIRAKQVTSTGTNYYWFKTNPFVGLLTATPSTGSTFNYIFSKPTTLSTTQNEVKQFSIYPNPTSGNISIKNIDFSNKSMFVKVYNMLGNQIVNNYKLETESANIDLSNYASGLYFIEIADENNKVIYQDKIIKK